MPQKLPVNGFEWVKNILIINKKLHKFIELIKNYGDDSDGRYILKVDVEYPIILHDLNSALPFLPKKMKINKCHKLLCKICNKKNYVVHIRSLKQALNHGLVLKKVHRLIQFNQKTWLKEYIDMNTKLITEAKNDFEKDFFKLMNNSIFGKAMETVRKHKDIKLATTDKRKKIRV